MSDKSLQLQLAIANHQRVMAEALIMIVDRTLESHRSEIAFKMREKLKDENLHLLQSMAIAKS